MKEKKSMVVFDGFLKTEVYFENVGMVLRM